MIGEITLRFCIGVAAESTAEAALSDGTGRVYKLLSSALNSAKVFCRSRRVGAGGGLEETAAAAILDALASAASIVVENSIEIVYMLATDYSGVSRAIYYPGADGLKHVSKRIRVILNESIRGIAEKLVKASNVRVNLDELARCLAAAFRDALDRAVRGDGRGTAAQPAHDAGPRVFTLFHRSLLGRRRSLVRAVTDAVKGLLGLGLLDAYREMLRSVPGLGFEDLLVAGGEVLLKTRSEMVPASVLGDGALHLLLLTAGLALARGGGAVVVIEEPETGLHPGYMGVFARLLVDSVAEARGGRVLVAMSTHSLELIRYIVAEAKERGLLGSLATVLIYEGEVYSVFQGEEAAEASELDVDLRGV
ncbi:MAG: ATP-binding protein [Crenarchaeota archaeon]|nr:ATP-binding protein [Thermoproteota archaeon]